MHPLIFHKCLAEATRLKMLLLLTQEQELCVCELTETLGSSQPKISRHLALLKKHGLIQDRRQGQWIYYRLHNCLPEWCRESLEQTLTANPNYASQPGISSISRASCQ